ncbi:hypothetical protein [Rhodococcus koreensis]|uniref:hypothetical protein n=1 Tax=Rhodococcus koreensis TaxID=99653 RepID=UPI0036724052
MTKLVDAVADLNPQPRERQWTSLTFCILDAVWSIGAKYNAVVVPLVRRVGEDFRVTSPSVAMTEPKRPDPVPLSEFVARFDNLDFLVERTNRQRTSPTGGILKADAVLQHAHAFLQHGIDTLDQAVALFSDDARFGEVNASLSGIRGDGQDAVRRGYLWMLIGREDMIKPDRMVLRWFARQGISVDSAGARTLVALIASHLQTRSGRRLTPWEVDHAIWLAGRSLPLR